MASLESTSPAVTPDRCGSRAGDILPFCFDAIGTSWQIDTPEPLPSSLRREIFDRIERFDAVYSRFRADSLVTRIARAEAGGRFAFPDDCVPLFDLYDRLHAVTDGAVDPLVGRDLELLGYDPGYSLRAGLRAIALRCRQRGSWHRMVRREGSVITTDRPQVIDVGGAGKGYLIDITAQILRDAGCYAFVIDASGDLLHAGQAPLVVGLEHPSNPALAIGIARLTGQSLCASATNRRAWGDFHHVVDARSGACAREVVATWVVAESALAADGLATALFFAAPQRLAASFEFSCVRMFADGRAEMSSSFDGELFT
jgi:FAD:protein FMN transferase